jgi:hypothetical protein
MRGKSLTYRRSTYKTLPVSDRNLRVGDPKNSTEVAGKSETCRASEVKDLTRLAAHRRSQTLRDLPRIGALRPYRTCQSEFEESEAHAGGLYLYLQKVAQQPLSCRRQNGLRMKLHPFDFFLAMTQAHDHTVARLGGDLQTRRQAFTLDYQ